MANSLGLWPLAARCASEPDETARKAIRELANGFLKRHGIPGLSVAFGRAGAIDFAAGYGFAESDRKVLVIPQHRFRIASVTKPFTATAVMKAEETGLLRRSDRVFGPDGILGNAYGKKLPDDVRSITVDHLLTHTGGGWSNQMGDPMFQHAEMNHHDLIAWTLANRPLDSPPGTRFAYSNFGYCVLGRVLEKVSGNSYPEYLRQQILDPIGIRSMTLAGNTLAERHSEEVTYHTDKPGEAYGMKVNRMDSHGGWIATASDLVRFASQLPTLLSNESIRTMTTPGLNQNYARGWAVNPVPNWWHTGSLPGTTTILVHTAKDLCWAGLLNGRTKTSGAELDRLMWQMARAVKAWW
ncbi:MAG: beta-lactamase family protein [Akkermansiaceae bacterium]|nr:beta-lactamase family protein [Akkermansiaceae bacterium]MCP5550864.1 beta-lactamase family protein [Akkermansiaceae bacterium]